MNRFEHLEAARKFSAGSQQEDTLNRIAGFWSVFMNDDFSEGEVAAMLALAEFARYVEIPVNTEHWDKAAGYVALAAEIEDAMKATLRDEE